MKTSELQQIIREEIKRMLKIAGLIKEGVDDNYYPFSKTNIFLHDDYLTKLDKLVRAKLTQANNDPNLLKSINLYVDVLEAGWRDYDDTFDGEFDEFDGDSAAMDIVDAHTTFDGKEVAYTTAKKRLDAIDPALRKEIYDLFMDGKADYYEEG